MSKTNDGGISQIMVFRPSWQEFEDFGKYIDNIESQGAHKSQGVAKIIPPPEWVARRNGYNLDNLNINIPMPISQTVTGTAGVYRQTCVPYEQLTLRQFQNLAHSPQFQTPPHNDYDDLERIYWENMREVVPIYGADVNGSIMDAEQEIWNLNRLGSILDVVKEDYGAEIDGVNTPYLYFGTWKSTFPWHTEDMDLYSINYLHFGAPKTWYSVPPSHGRAFERVALKYFESDFMKCDAYLRHKMVVMSPKVLREHNVPVSKITQEAGEIIITFPFGYHSGFNHGFNCAEATNFASKRWIEYGKHAKLCQCSDDAVQVPMEAFVKRFQPKRFKDWLEGRDPGRHPEGPPNSMPPCVDCTHYTGKPDKKRKPKDDDEEWLPCKNQRKNQRSSNQPKY